MKEERSQGETRAGGHEPSPARHLRQRRGKILYLLILALVLGGFLPVWFLSKTLIDISEEELTSTLTEMQFTQASAIGVALDEKVDEARARVGDLAHAFGATASREGLHQLLSSQDFLRRFVDEDLILLRFEAPDGRDFQSRTQHPISADDVKRLLSVGMNQGGEIIGRPTFLPAAGISVVVISRPVLAGKQLAGVLSAVYSLDPTWDQILREFNLPYTAYVLDQAGNLIAHTDPDQPRGLALERNDLVQTFLSPYGRDTKETTRFVENGRQGPVRMLGTRVPTGYQWGVFVQVEEALAFGPAHAMRQKSFKLSMATLALGVMVALLFASYITRPIRRLAQASRAFARGEFGTRVHVKARNEIGELADTFNHMSEELELHIQELKDAAEKYRELFMGTTQALATAIDEKDPYTRGHSERVNRFSLILGKHMGLSEKELTNLHLSALLHDIGKIGIDDRILRKPAALTDEEFEIMKQHPTRGANILAGVSALADVIPGMKHHHERYSGGGYPDGLMGDSIPLAARIIQVADAIDAMTTNRPYQRAMEMETAVQRLNDLAGKMSDPKVVDALNRAWRCGDLEALKIAPGAQTVRAIRQGNSTS
jgi:HD-GYP domain-containing protein (c-di-GMP phosphodiesterase class II)